MLNDLLSYARSITEPGLLKRILETAPWRVVSGDGWRLELLMIDAPFQVERAAILPNHSISIHRHPHADTYELYLDGEFELWINCRRFPLNERQPANHRLLSIPHTAWHGGRIGPRGALFLSIQKWRGDPMPVTEDWEGQLPGEPVARTDG